jgi:hypothetical protein
MTLTDLIRREFENRAGVQVHSIEPCNSEQLGDGFTISCSPYQAVFETNFFTIIHSIDFEEWIINGWCSVDEFDCTRLSCDVCGSSDVIEVPHMGRNCNRCHPL